MNLNLENKLFIVGGASAGFGRAIAENLINEGARILAVARNKVALEKFRDENTSQVEIFTGDLTEEGTIDKLLESINPLEITGFIVNAGGPPAMGFLETSLKDWDEAYYQLVRWKVDLSLKLLPSMVKNEYGRMLFIESVSVKQPIENLVLSNSMRMAVTGFVKSISQDIASTGVTLNILAPGYHETNAIVRLLDKKAAAEGISAEEAKKAISSKIPTGFMGDPDDFATLATWLLSEKSKYITGQTISVDGGLVKGVFG